MASTHITFKNLHTAAVKVLWVPSATAEERLYRTLQPSEEYKQQTYVGHQWHVRDANDNHIVWEGPGAPDHFEAVIKEPGAAASADGTLAYACLSLPPLLL